MSFARRYMKQKLRYTTQHRYRKAKPRYKPRTYTYKEYAHNAGITHVQCDGVPHHIERHRGRNKQHYSPMYPRGYQSWKDY